MDFDAEVDTVRLTSPGTSELALPRPAPFFYPRGCDSGIEASPPRRLPKQRSMVPPKKSLKVKDIVNSFTCGKKQIQMAQQVASIIEAQKKQTTPIPPIFLNSSKTSQGNGIQNPKTDPFSHFPAKANIHPPIGQGRMSQNAHAGRAGGPYQRQPTAGIHPSVVKIYSRSAGSHLNERWVYKPPVKSMSTKIVPHPNVTTESRSYTETNLSQTHNGVTNHNIPTIIVLSSSYPNIAPASDIDSEGSRDIAPLPFQDNTSPIGSSNKAESPHIPDFNAHDSLHGEGSDRVALKITTRPLLTSDDGYSSSDSTPISTPLVNGFPDVSLQSPTQFDLSLESPQSPIEPAVVKECKACSITEAPPPTRWKSSKAIPAIWQSKEIMNSGPSATSRGTSWMQKRREGSIDPARLADIHTVIDQGMIVASSWTIRPDSTSESVLRESKAAPFPDKGLGLLESLDDVFQHPTPSESATTNTASNLSKLFDENLEGPVWHTQGSLTSAAESLNNSLPTLITLSSDRRLGLETGSEAGINTLLIATELSTSPESYDENKVDQMASIHQPPISRQDGIPIILPETQPLRIRTRAPKSSRPDVALSCHMLRDHQDPQSEGSVLDHGLMGLDPVSHSSPISEIDEDWAMNLVADYMRDLTVSESLERLCGRQPRNSNHQEDFSDRNDTFQISLQSASTSLTLNQRHYSIIAASTQSFDNPQTPKAQDDSSSMEFNQTFSSSLSDIIYQAPIFANCELDTLFSPEEPLPITEERRETYPKEIQESNQAGELGSTHTTLPDSSCFVFPPIPETPPHIHSLPFPLTQQRTTACSKIPRLRSTLLTSPERRLFGHIPSRLGPVREELINYQHDTLVQLSEPGDQNMILSRPIVLSYRERPFFSIAAPDWTVLMSCCMIWSDVVIQSDTPASFVRVVVEEFMGLGEERKTIVTLTLAAHDQVDEDRAKESVKSSFYLHLPTTLQAITEVWQHVIRNGGAQSRQFLSS